MSPEFAGDPALGQRRHLSTREKARKRAVDLLFEADLRGVDPLEILAAHEALNDPPVREFTAELVRGVATRGDEIDSALADALTGGWTLERMPRVDRVLSRLATFELYHGSAPVRVVLAEATQLATELSTDNSPAFVNGLLARVADGVPPRGDDQASDAENEPE